MSNEQRGWSPADFEWDHFAVLGAAVGPGRALLRVDHAYQAPDGVDSVQLASWSGWPASPCEGAVLVVVAPNTVSWHDPRTLEQAKAAKTAQINQSRLLANKAGFMFAGKLISTDELSRGDIDGTNGTVALTGQFPEGFPGFWKAADNSYVPVPDIETWKMFYASMAAQGAANFATSEALKAQRDAAATVAEVDQITWP